MKIKQTIKIEGRNWNDLMRLGCVREIKDTGGVVTVLVSAVYEDGRELAYVDVVYGTWANIGDMLIEYDNGTWEVRHEGNTSLSKLHG